MAVEDLVAGAYLSPWDNSGGGYSFDIADTGSYTFDDLYATPSYYEGNLQAGDLPYETYGYDYYAEPSTGPSFGGFLSDALNSPLGRVGENYMVNSLIGQLTSGIGGYEGLAASLGLKAGYQTLRNNGGWGDFFGNLGKGTLSAAAGIMGGPLAGIFTRYALNKATEPDVQGALYRDMLQQRHAMALDEARERNRELYGNDFFSPTESSREFVNPYFYSLGGGSGPIEAPEYLDFGGFAGNINRYGGDNVNNEVPSYLANLFSGGSASPIAMLNAGYGYGGGFTSDYGRTSLFGPGSTVSGGVYRAPTGTYSARPFRSPGRTPARSSSLGSFTLGSGSGTMPASIDTVMKGVPAGWPGVQISPINKVF